ncbi:G1/S-specific cyclin-D3 [Merluccius polli]|uniref:G1/S-specific cyclin-D3 n=1 Tax=Merluccius polli TaxID=89951 RepID=A0AA47MXW0_MERPO|nr:G1/S-specific cyclin-D3 [Merluccius polli]
MSDLSLWCEEVEEEVEDQCEDMGQAEEKTTETRGQVAGPSQVRAAWDPAASGQRAIHRLLQLEERYTPSALYIALAQRDPEQREELAKWALEVCCECGCDEAVFPLCMSLMDRFLSASLSLPVSPYCLAAACILIASKLSECDNVPTDTLCAAADYSFQASNLREMERVVLGTLRWDTAAVTPQDFLPLLLAPVGARMDGETDRAALLSTMRRHGDTLVAMCVCDSRFLGAPPSLVAAAALNSAFRGLSHRSPSQLASLGELLAGLCQTDTTVLQCYSEMIEYALRQRLRTEPMEKDAEVEDERAGTPTDMREIDF